MIESLDWQRQHCSDRIFLIAEFAYSDGAGRETLDFSINKAKFILGDSLGTPRIYSQLADTMTKNLARGLSSIIGRQTVHPKAGLGRERECTDKPPLASF